MHGLDIVLFEGLNGIVWGLILALLSLGLCLVFGLMGIINLAHGSIYMLGAMIAVYCIQTLGLNFWLSVIVAPVVVAILCLVFNRALFARIAYRSPAIGLLATAGLLLIIDYTVLATFGGAPHSIASPLPGVVRVFGVFYPTFRLVAALISLVILGGVWAFLRFSRYGLWMRAVPQAPQLAAAAGVPIFRVNELTVILAGATAGVAGALIVPISGAYYQMGLTVLAAMFMVVVVGGLGNLFGVVVISICFGLARGLFTIVMEPSWAQIASLLALFPVLYFMPNGIFGTR